MKQTEDEILIILIEHLKQIGWTIERAGNKKQSYKT
jgi:hypothetical protein